MPDIGVALSTIVSGVLLGGMLALTALGLSIVLGVMRLVNLAHGDFVVVGAYVGLFFLKFTGVDPLLGLPVIALIVAALAIPLYRLLLAPLAERGPEAQMMTMFAVAIILENAFVLGFSADTRSIERDYATPPSDPRPRHCAADLCHWLCNCRRPDPRRALVDFEDPLRTGPAGKRC